MANFFAQHGSNMFDSEISSLDAGQSPTNYSGLELANLNKNILPLYFRLVFDEAVADPYILAMYVNPSRLTRSFKKKISRQKTLAGWAEFHWGDELVSLSVEAVTGAFLNPKTWRIESAAKRGETVAWKAFKSLLDVYENNGVVWSTGREEGGNPFQFLKTDSRYVNGDFSPVGYPVRAGKLQLIYDSITYDGYFETFEYSEKEESPYIITFSFSFKAYSKKQNEGEPRSYSRQGDLTIPGDKPHTQSGIGDLPGNVGGGQ